MGDESIEYIALEECAVSFTSKLDPSAIFAHLTAQHLLTEDDKQVLMSNSRTSREKANYIMHILPRKADGWFDKLLQCLRESADGTGHEDLLKDLESKRQELRERRRNTGTPNTTKKHTISASGGSEEPLLPVGSRPEEVRRRARGRQEEAYSIFLESSGNHSNHTLRVRSSDTVGSLMDKVRVKLNVPHLYGIRLISGSQELRLNNSLRDSNITNNSRIVMVVVTRGGQTS